MTEKHSPEARPKASGRGGARPGAGRKPGKLSQAKRDIAEKAKEYGEKALQTLADICEKGETESARVAAANALLDRGYGKAPQKIDATVDIRSEDTEALRAELERLAPALLPGLAGGKDD